MAGAPGCGVGGEDMHVGLHPWGSGDTASYPRHSRPGRGCSKVHPRDALSSRWTMIIPREPLGGGREVLYSDGSLKLL